MIQPADAQGELNLRTRHARCVVCADSVNELCSLLAQRGWLTAAEILDKRPEWTERFIRLLASASGGRVLSGPGTPGYCLASEATLPELDHAGKSLVSQGRAMVHRGIRFLRAAAAQRAKDQLLSQPQP